MQNEMEIFYIFISYALFITSAASRLILGNIADIHIQSGDTILVMQIEARYHV